MPSYAVGWRDAPMCTAGGVVYEIPRCLGFISTRITVPPESIAVALAPCAGACAVPPPPENVTVGGILYPGCRGAG